MINVRNPKCMKGGCLYWESCLESDRECTECDRCGFNFEEDARRKEIPLVMCKDGKRRKIIPAKQPKETLS